MLIALAFHLCTTLVSGQPIALEQTVRVNSKTTLDQVSQSSAEQESIQWITPEVLAPGLQRYILDSKVAQVKVSYHLYLPEAYRSESSRRYPVIYWLHGSGGGLPGIRPITRFFDAAIRSGKIPPAILVFPNSFASGMWCDSMDGNRPIESVFIKELLPEVDAKFRTIAKPEGRILEGFSMGGYGAGRLGFKYPELFGGISMLAGGPLDLEFRGPRAEANPVERTRILESVYGGQMSVFKKQSPWTIAETNSDKLRKCILIRMCIGESDFTLPANREFSAHLKQLSIPHTLKIVPNVGHDTLALLRTLGDENWRFYRAVLQP